MRGGGSRYRSNNALSIVLPLSLNVYLLRYLRLSDAAPDKTTEWQEHQTIILFIVYGMSSRNVSPLPY
jgi:hypothetical protein